MINNSKHCLFCTLCSISFHYLSEMVCFSAWNQPPPVLCPQINCPLVFVSDGWPLRMAEGRTTAVRACLCMCAIVKHQGHSLLEVTSSAALPSFLFYLLLLYIPALWGHAWNWCFWCKQQWKHTDVCWIFFYTDVLLFLYYKWMATLSKYSVSKYLELYYYELHSHSCNIKQTI